MPHLASLIISLLISSVTSNPISAKRDTPSDGFYPPAANRGSMLTILPYIEDYGEPLNVIISGNSDPVINTEDGFLSFMKAVGFAGECLGQHIGDRQQANLGDGNPAHNETAVLRWYYGDFQFGTCKESVEGGNHLRYWQQNGKSGNSSAWFLAVSVEKSAKELHMIVNNGYDAGRDQLVGNATQSISADDIAFTTTVDYLPGLLPNGTKGINHGIAIDGRVAVLTVKTNITGTVVPAMEDQNASIRSTPAVSILLLAWAVALVY